jgi:hypothetical protein
LDYCSIVVRDNEQEHQMNNMNVRKRLNAAQPVYADYFDERTGQQTRIRVVKLTSQRSTGRYTLQGINGEVSPLLDDSRVAFSVS